MVTRFPSPSRILMVRVEVEGFSGVLSGMLVGCASMPKETGRLLTVK